MQRLFKAAPLFVRASRSVVKNNCKFLFQQQQYLFPSLLTYKFYSTTADASATSSSLSLGTSSLLNNNISAAMKHLKTAAEDENNLVAGILLMCLYSDGIHFQPDFKQVSLYDNLLIENQASLVTTLKPSDLEYLQPFANSKHPLIATLLGHLYSEGMIFEMDKTKAKELLSEAMRASYSPAYMYMGICLYGEGQFDEAIQVLNDIPIKSPIAFYLAGLCNELSGKIKEAVENYEHCVTFDVIKTPQVSNAYYVIALANMGKLNRHGLHLPMNIDKAVKHLKIAADLNNYNAIALLGMMHLQGQFVEKDAKKAVYYFERAVKEHNHMQAQYMLANCYEQGIGVEKDAAKALQLLEASAQQQYVYAIDMLASKYYEGSGELLPKDQAKALELWKTIADPNGANYADAQTYTGTCYYYGHGTSENLEEAVKYFKMAVAQGHAEAQFHLGTCYCLGFGIERSEKEGLALYKLAAAQGHEKAKEFLQMDEIMKQKEAEMKKTAPSKKTEAKKK